MSAEVEPRTPAADWDTAFEAVYRIIRRYPVARVVVHLEDDLARSNHAAMRNAVVWRGVMAALEATNPIQPTGRDYAGEPEFDVAPISTTVGGEHWWTCPRCAAQLDHDPSHDVSIDGMGLMATPDVYRCERCDYRYAD